MEFMFDVEDMVEAFRAGLIAAVGKRRVSPDSHAVHLAAARQIEQMKRSQEVVAAHAASGSIDPVDMGYSESVAPDDDMPMTPHEEMAQHLMGTALDADPIEEENPVENENETGDLNDVDSETGERLVDD